MPSSLLVFTNAFLPIASVQLGRLVLDMASPWQDFCRYPLTINASDVIVASEPRLRQIVDRGRSNGATFQDNVINRTSNLTRILINLSRFSCRCKNLFALKFRSPF